MSVKRVKISELPQLQPDTSGEGIFMPAADENNRSYRVPLSRYDNAKNEADSAASVAEKAAEGAMAAAQEANDAADRANDAAEKANGIVDNKIVVANSLSFGYREKGAVFAPPLSLRGTPQDAGSLIYRLGKAYTIDTVLPTSGDLGALLMNACKTGDVSVQFTGDYTNGWRRNGTYGGVGEVHLMNGTPVAVVTDLGEDLGTRWMYVPNQWTKLGGAGDGAAEEALAAANEAKTTATAAQATANQAKVLATTLADTDIAGGVYSPDYPGGGIVPENLTHNIAFAQGRGIVFAPLLAQGYPLYRAVQYYDGASIQVTFRLYGNYTGGWSQSGNITGTGFLSIYPGGIAIAAMRNALTGASLGLYAFIKGEWEPILAPSSVAARDMDGAEAQTAPAASGEPSAGAAMPEAREASEASEAPEAPEDSETESCEAVPAAVFSDTAPAVEAEAGEAETEAELGKEAIGTMENLTAGKWI